MSQENFPETNGVIYSLQKGNAWVLYNDVQGKRRMKRFYINYIEFIDERFNKFFE